MEITVLFHRTNVLDKCEFVSDTDGERKRARSEILVARMTANSYSKAVRDAIAQQMVIDRAALAADPSVFKCEPHADHYEILGIFPGNPPIKRSADG